MNYIKAIENHDKLCWNCLKNSDNIKIIKIPELGYGSYFDCFETEIHLCPECYEKTKELWSLKRVNNTEYVGMYDEYENEDKIIDFFEQLPPESKQFVYNQFDTGFDAHPLPPQIWMDYHINKCLTHEQCEDYGLISFEIIKSYEDRFPTCKHPVNIVFEDKSVGCWCPYGAVGDKDQKVSINISHECYKCEHYVVRTKEEKLRSISSKSAEGKDILKF